jgi:hypothetical protein
MLLLSRFMARIRAWRASWRRPQAYDIPLIVPAAGPIFREVSSNGVRVFSLCGSCGARMETSATLCNACARRRSPSSPF